MMVVMRYKIQFRPVYLAWWFVYIDWRATLRLLCTLLYH